LETDVSDSSFFQGIDGAVVKLPAQFVHVEIGSFRMDPIGQKNRQKKLYSDA